MAPVKKMRTYQNKNRSIISKSVSVFNDLLARNLRKRLERSEHSLNETVNKSRETTFDRLLRGEVYNKVTVKKFPKNPIIDITKLNSSDHDESKNTTKSRSHNEHCKSSLKKGNDSDVFTDISNKSVTKSQREKSSLMRSPIGTRSRIKKKYNSSSIAEKESMSSIINTTAVTIDSSGDLRNSDSFKISSHVRPKATGALKRKSKNIKSQSLSTVTKLEFELNSKASDGKEEMNGSGVMLKKLNFMRSIELSHDKCSKTGRSHSLNECCSNKLTHRNSHNEDKKRDCSEAASSGISNNRLDSFENNSASRYNDSGDLQFTRCDFKKHVSHLSIRGNFKTISDKPCVPNSTDNQKAQHANLTINNFQQFAANLASTGSEHFGRLRLASTPLRAHEWSCRNDKSTTLFSNETNSNLVNKSYEIIDIWSYKCPSPSSFSISKYKRTSSTSKRIYKKKLSRSKKIFKTLAVQLHRMPELEKLLQGKMENINQVSNKSINLLALECSKRKRSSLTSSHEFVTRRKTPKRRNWNHSNQPPKFPIVLLTPLKSQPRDEVENYKERKFISSLSKRNCTHVCFKECDCFQISPKVILTRIDGLICDPYKPSIPVVDLTEESENEYDSVEDIFLNESNSSKSFLNNLKDCYIALNRLDVNQMVSQDNEMQHSCGRQSERTKQCFVLLNDLNKSRSKESGVTLAEDEGAHVVSHVGDVACKVEEFDSKDSFIIESSITEEKNLRPNRRKYIPLAAGKKFRRSISVFKLARDNFNISGYDGTVGPDKSFGCTRRLTHKFVAISPVKERSSLLESYARNSTGLVESRHPDKSPRAKRRITNKFVAVSSFTERPSELESFAKNSAGFVSGREEHPDKVPLDQRLRNLNISINDCYPLLVEESIVECTARDIVLKRCGQTEPLNFEKCYPPSALQHCQKIGEGVFGEVFLFRDKNSTTVMKIIPIESDLIVNLEKQKTFAEILSEIVISSELSDLRRAKHNNTDNFTEVKKIRCVYGCYPDRLLELWELYDENKHSENDSPEIFGNQQLYIVLELSNGGIDLEAFVFKNAQQALAVFHQVACALAVAEKVLQFEHRDLHWGNVLVKFSEERKSTFVIDGKEVTIDNNEAKATVIDFTFSRIELDGVVIFNDLSMDKDLFTAKGDYQFEIYRLMQERNGNEWQSFQPYTNILWLHYILDKAITAFRYKNVKSKIHKTSLKTFEKYKNDILNYQSVTDFVLANLSLIR